MKTRPYYRRKLPHLQPKEGTFFVTYRLYGSIPQSKLKAIRANYDLALIELEKKSFDNHEKRFDQLPLDLQNQLTSIFNKKKYNLSKIYFRDIDDYLDKKLNPPYWLQKPEIAQLNKEALHFYDGDRYDLLAYCIMSNHVHVLFKLLPDAPDLEVVMQNLKSYTGKEGNKILGRTGEGQFWEEESFDHLLRQGEFERVVKYILNNPVKAKMVKHWEDWKWSYKKEGIIVEW